MTLLEWLESQNAIAPPTPARRPALDMLAWQVGDEIVMLPPGEIPKIGNFRPTPVATPPPGLKLTTST